MNVKLRPSMYPPSSSPVRIAFITQSGVAIPKNPTTGVATDCARAETVRARTAPPARAKNSRRFIRYPFDYGTIVTGAVVNEKVAIGRAIVAFLASLSQGESERLRFRHDIMAVEFFAKLGVGPDLSVAN